MRKPHLLFFLICIFFGCQKKSINTQQIPDFENRIVDEPNKGENFLTSINGEKNVAFPDFDLTRPIYSNGKDVTITTYFEANYAAGSTDYWTLHEFVFGNESLRLMYHFVGKESGVTISDVYDMNRTYQFTYIDNHGNVSIDYINPQSPQQLPPGFYNCMKQYIYEFDVPTIIYGGPFYTYFAYKCYKKLAKSH